MKNNIYLRFLAYFSSIYIDLYMIVMMILHRISQLMNMIDSSTIQVMETDKPFSLQRKKPHD